MARQRRAEENHRTHITRAQPEGDGGKGGREWSTTLRLQISGGAVYLDENQARIVRLIYQWYVIGDENERPLKLVDIRLRLFESGVKPPLAKRGAASEWGAETIRRVLSSETYCGVWRFGKTIGGTGKRGKRAKENQIAVLEVLAKSF